MPRTRGFRTKREAEEFAANVRKQGYKPEVVKGWSSRILNPSLRYLVYW